MRLSDALHFTYRPSDLMLLFPNAERGCHSLQELHHFSAFILLMYSSIEVFVALAADPNPRMQPHEL